MTRALCSKTSALGRPLAMGAPTNVLTAPRASRCGILNTARQTDNGSSVPQIMKDGSPDVRPREGLEGNISGPLIAFCSPEQTEESHLPEIVRILSCRLCVIPGQRFDHAHVLLDTSIASCLLSVHECCPWGPKDSLQTDIADQLVASVQPLGSETTILSSWSPP